MLPWSVASAAAVGVSPVLLLTCLLLCASSAATRAIAADEALAWSVKVPSEPPPKFLTCRKPAVYDAEPVDSMSYTTTEVLKACR